MSNSIHQTGPLVARFARNPLGRDLIAGDVHGHFSRLAAALDAVAFDPVRDRLFSVGDLVDRGPESDHALDWLARPWFYAVSGNHEDRAIRWPRGQNVGGVWVRNMPTGHYVQNGGSWNVSNPPDVSAEFAAAFAALPVAIELETEAGLVGIVHADVPGGDWVEFVAALAAGGARGASAIDKAQWSRARIDAHLSGFPTSPVVGVHAVVVGHTPVDRATVLGNVYHIDTKGWREGGRFTLLDAHTLCPADPPSPIRW